MLDIGFVWKSTMCACSATTDGNATSVHSCTDDHSPWAEAVAEQVFANKTSEAEKLANRGFNKEFQRHLDLWVRFTKESGCFFRPPLLPKGDLPPDLAMYLVESLGATINSTSDPLGFATYLQGKAIQGLMREMWVEDYNWPEGRLLWPEELVAEGYLTTDEAKTLFRRRVLSEDLLQLFTTTKEEKEQK